MKRMTTIAVFSVTLAIASAYVYSQREARNRSYEYCTTRAYGWPFPSRIDNCECDGHGGLTEYPRHAKIWNAGSALMLSVVVAGAAQMLLGVRR